MPLELWQKSTEDVRERWRDIARTLNDVGDAEALPRALQTCFWFGAEAIQPGRSLRTEMTLRLLLPPESIEQLAKRPTAPPGGAPAAPPSRRRS